MAETAWGAEAAGLPADQLQLITQQVWRDEAFGLWLPDGVIRNLLTDTPLQPYGDSSGRVIKVSPGAARVGGLPYRITSTLTLTVDPNTSGLPRVDGVVVRLDLAAQTCRVIVVKGDPASSPVAPPLEDSVTQRDVRLGTVAVANGAVTITAANVVDARQIIPHGRRTPRGVVAYASMSTDGSYISAEAVIAPLSVSFVADSSRLYSGHLHLRLVEADAGALHAVVRSRWAPGGAVTPAGIALAATDPSGPAGLPQPGGMEFLIKPGQMPDGPVTVGVTLASAGTGNVRQRSAPTGSDFWIEAIG